ncbi:interleukin-1 beta [Embiotoca jacksoni]|uniref:interleukin-1 beta n=1 Tax=Embiotoca jacksoni TaxID=100190 RepID=UPI0037037878
MDKFDLSQALDRSLELEENKCNMKKITQMEENQPEQEVWSETFTLDEGLDLEVSYNRRTLESVVRLVLAVNRMTASHCGCKHRANEVCSTIIDNMVDETIVKMVRNSSTGKTRAVFQRVNSVKECTLCDNLQRHVVEQPGTLKLQAITLQGGNCQYKVNFKMSRYVTTCVSPDDGLTVLLSITNDLHLCCDMEEDKAVLTLKNCDEKALKNISSDGNMNRFLFYKKTEGICQTTFESVKFRGWFISTSDSSENQPVEMCQRDSGNRQISFKMI